MGEYVLRLDPELTIYGAAALRQQLADALDQPEPVALDLTDVCEIDSAGLQLLMAARRAADGCARPLRLLGTGAAVRDALAMFGLDDQARGGRHGS